MKITGVILDNSIATMKDGTQKYIVQIVAKEVNFGTAKSSLVDVEMKNKTSFDEAVAKKAVSNLDVGYNIYKDKLSFVEL